MATHATRAGTSTHSEAKARSVLRDYSLAWVLLALFVSAWVAQFYGGWMAFAAEAREHGEAAAMLGRDGYIWQFSSATFENWQSEFLQLLAFVVLTSFLVFHGSPESKDSDEEMKAAIERLTDEVQQLRRQSQ